MDNKQKFENFLESLKGKGQDVLIESVKTGFQACFEYIEYDEDFDDWNPMPELKKIIDKLNEYLDDTYAVSQINDDYFKLSINEKPITEGDFEDIQKRLNGISREHGLQYQD